MTGPVDAAGSRPSSAHLSAARPSGGPRTGANNFGAAPDAPPPSAGEAARLRWAAEQLESVFINELWKSMRRTVNKTGMFDGPGVRLFEEMLDEERSRAMAAGGGLGLAALLYEQLSAHIQETPPIQSPTASSAVPPTGGAAEDATGAAAVPPNDETEN